MSNNTPTAEQPFPAPQPLAPQAPAPVAPPAPGKGLAITGLVLAFLLPPIGLILSIVAGVKLKKAAAPKGMAVAGIIVGALFTVLEIIVVIAMISVFSSLFSMCTELGPGVWEVSGTTYTCG